MIPISIIVWIILICCYVSFIVFIYLLYRKINLFEQKIYQLFQKRLDHVPWLYEVSQETIQKPEEIFQEVLLLRKQIFGVQKRNAPFLEIIHTQSRIHNELNFIFKICNTHQKLIKKGNFIYLRDLIIDKSYQISEMIEVHKIIVWKYNLLIKMKNMTLIGYLIPISYKHHI